MASVGPQSAVLNSILHPGAKRKLWEANPEFMCIAHGFESGKFSKNSWMSFKEIIFRCACILKNHVRESLEFTSQESSVSRSTGPKGQDFSGPVGSLACKWQ